MRAISRCLLLLSVAACACTSSNAEEECEKSTNAGACDLFLTCTTVVSAPGGPLLAQVQVAAGQCDAPAPCPSGCQTIGVSSDMDISPGTTCDLVAIATDGRSQAFRVTAVEKGPPISLCCSNGLTGMWVTYTPFGFPSEVVVDFSVDGGVPDGGDVGDSGISDG